MRLCRHLLGTGDYCALTQGGKKAGQMWDKFATKVGQKRDKSGMKSTFSRAMLVASSPGAPFLVRIKTFHKGEGGLPEGQEVRGRAVTEDETRNLFLPHPPPLAAPAPRGKVLARASVESSTHNLPGPRRSPTKWVRWGEEEQGSGGRATEGSPNRSGLCDDEGRWHGVAVTEDEKRGPRRSPTKWVRWGKEEQGSGARATKGNPKQSGLCSNAGQKLHYRSSRAPIFCTAARSCCRSSWERLCSSSMAALYSRHSSSRPFSVSSTHTRVRFSWS